MFKKIIFGIFLFFGIFVSNTYGATITKGGTIGSETWTAGNTYNITSSLTIPSGSTLTIEAGTVVKVNTNFNIMVVGNLQAIGNINDKIIFTSVNDNSVGNSIGTGTPSKGDWGYIYFNGVGSNSSMMNYTEVKYGGRSIYSVNIYVSTATITNSIISDSLNNGINITSGNATIKNNIIYKNSGIGINKSGGTPNISYNLYYLNDGGDSNVGVDGNSITGQNPMFVDEVGYELQSSSPAINAGDPGMGNHPVSGNTYDIGVNEYLGVVGNNNYLDLVYGATLSGTQNRNLTYDWNFTNTPIGTPPTISVSSGTINSDGIISTTLTLRQKGNYSIKLIIKELGNIIGEGTNNFIFN